MAKDKTPPKCTIMGNKIFSPKKETQIIMASLATHKNLLRFIFGLRIIILK